MPDGLARLTRFTFLALLAPSLVACTGTRLHERADVAASASDFPRAVAYDEIAARDRPAQPSSFDAHYAEHAAGYAQQVLARLGPPTSASADSQAIEVRGLLVWARAQNEEAAVRPAASARLGELAHVRWERVQALANASHLDEAVVLGRALVVDAPAELAERRELALLEGKARAAHEAEVVSLAGAPDHEGAVALHERFARQMGGAETAVGKQAEATLARRTGLATTIDATNAGECEGALGGLRALLSGSGDTPAHFAFRFARCARRRKESSTESWRTTTVGEDVDQTMSDLVPTMDCRMVSTGSATICDGRGRNGCHEEGTSGQKCTQGYRSVEHTERVRRTHTVQSKYLIKHLELELEYEVTLSADIDGEHFEVDSRSVATSGLLSQDDSAPSESEAFQRATSDLTRRLDGFTRALALFARKTQSAKLRRDAKDALAAGDPGRAESLYVVSSIVQGAAAPELVFATLEQAQVEAALSNRAYERADGAPTPPVLPAIAPAEVLEDAHERTDSMTLSAEARAGYMGGIFGGVSRYATPVPGESTTGGFVALLAGGAEEVGTRFTGAGGAMHLLANFDGGTSSFDFSFDLGFGLKAAQVYVLPVGGLAAGTSTHASPSDSGFRPNAALRATALDAVYGGQITIALPYPLNVTLNAQVVRTAPVPLDDFKQWTTRVHATLGYHFSQTVDLMLFGRYWELDTVSVQPLEFFGGNGRDHRLLTVGVGIGGSHEKFLSNIFGGKKD